MVEAGQQPFHDVRRFVIESPGVAGYVVVVPVAPVSGCVVVVPVAAVAGQLEASLAST